MTYVVDEMEYVAPEGIQDIGADKKAADAHP